MRHVPVLLNEVLAGLSPQPGQNFIDGTVGDAGHSEKILELTGQNGRLLAIDADPESLLRAKQHLYNFAERVEYERANFSELERIVKEKQFGPVQGILLDLGWSSPQFEERGRGFSFAKDEPLDMRYSGSQSMSNVLTAAELMHDSTQTELENIFKNYGEENLYKEIAAAIVEQRKIKPIELTSELVEVVLQAYRTKLKTNKEVPWVGGLHPATKVFQALRIAVNNELGVVEEVIPMAVNVLASGGKLAIITFHSLEDRIVKHLFKELEAKQIGTIITKKPIECSPDEAAANPRARSAKLRILQKN
ncbi:MAG: 16S rRNA (cytosine(1402)-N(4))-methyltransferase RsmH [Candidatus Magasanikbacteria bacterium]|nr:16S rRNA (cytosine(1402)-N(4))-methyltransferase RsmH [Candidatus Magasanikbacteria bacterium]